METQKIVLCSSLPLLALALSGPLLASEHAPPEKPAAAASTTVAQGKKPASPPTAHQGPDHPDQAAAAILSQMIQDNNNFVHSHDRAYFEPFATSQHPRATIVACADSRFHLQAVNSAPDGDVFEIRNIGNQVDSVGGSVQYAMAHLNTPLLVIVGHVGCGAVKAAMGDYGEEPPAIRRELDSLHLSIRRTPAHGSFDEQWLASVQNNVHQQVAVALSEYGEQIRKGRLFVIGAVYDFRNDLGEGRGRLNIINVNGETQQARIQELSLLKEARRLTGARMVATKH